MSDQRAEDSCGSHGADPEGKPLFDYTCDDCMLPYNHKDWDEDPAYTEYEKRQARKAKRNSRASRTSRRLGTQRNTPRLRGLDYTP